MSLAGAEADLGRADRCATTYSQVLVGVELELERQGALYGPVVEVGEVLGVVDARRLRAGLELVRGALDGLLGRLRGQGEARRVDFG